MKLFIFHGDNQTQSRQALISQLENLKRNQIQLKWLDGLQITKPDLEIELTTQNLFQTEAIIIENLLTRPRSQTKTQCLKLLNNYHGSKDVYLWDKKTVSQTTLKQLQNQKPIVNLFKFPSYLFKFLDSFQPHNQTQALKLFHQTLTLTNEQLIFVMLTRRLAQLIQAKTAPDLLNGPNWQKQQLIRQSQTWNLNRLLSTYRQLIKIDYSIKTGQTQLDLVTQLDLLILGL